MAVPAGRLTFQQIRDQAVRKAGNPQLGQPLTGGPSPATIWLTQILYDLYTLYEWPFLFKAIPLTLLTSTFTLPSDFYESQDDNALTIQLTDNLQQAAIVLEVAADEFYAMQATQAVGTIPLYWTADRQTGLGLLFPDCTGHVQTCTFRYRAIPVAETTPPTTGDEAAINAVIPSFPWSRFLIQALYVECLQYERDPRYGDEKLALEQMKRETLQGSFTFQSQANTIPLDADVFRKPFRTDNISGG